MDSHRLISTPFSYQLHGSGQKVFLGNYQDRICLFCGQKAPNVSFKKEAHVIPAALGNRILFNYHECDFCNEMHFSLHENELANFLMLDRILVRSRKRSGSTKFKPVKGESFILGKVDTDQVQINLMDGENSFEIIESPDENSFTLKIKDPPPYSFVAICRCLTHMGWTLLPAEKRTSLTYVCDWLLGKVDLLPIYMDIRYSTGNGFAKVILELWEPTEEQSNYPVVIRFTFGFKVLTFYLPKDLDVNEPPKRNFNYIQFPPLDKFSIDALTLLNDERIKPTDLTYTMQFQSKSDSSPKDDIN